MKKIAAILFLILLLFNAFGYYLLFGYEQIQVRQQVIQEMPNSSFKIIKILVSPYAHIEDRDFEYVEGKFWNEGKAYNFVKKRIINDSLELYCLNNVRQDQLTARFNNFVKETVLNGNHSQNLPTKQFLKTFLKYYIPEATYTFFFLGLDTEGVTTIAQTNDLALPNPFMSISSPPPNAA